MEITSGQFLGTNLRVGVSTGSGNSVIFVLGFSANFLFVMNDFFDVGSKRG